MFNKEYTYESLLKLIEQVYVPCSFQLTDLSNESESHEYHACTFNLNSSKVIYRKAKKTPTKVGQFVTLWKRSLDGPIEPFCSSDNFDLVVINVEYNGFSGHFAFTKKALLENGILTHSTKEGKRGFRVYPPWDATTSKQAQKTQKWQKPFFLSANSNEKLDKERASKLY